MNLQEWLKVKTVVQVEKKTNYNLTQTLLYIIYTFFIQQRRKVPVTLDTIITNQHIGK